LNEPTESIAYLWQDTLIKGGLSILVAKPKVGKSTLARNLALAIARGDDSFLGRKIATSGPIVYLALQEKRSQVKNHFERMGATPDLDLPIIIHVGIAPEEAVSKLRTAIIENKAVLAIVDPLQYLARLPDLNDYGGVSLALEPLLEVARDTACHILLVHHANKGFGREGGDSILGSTAIFGSVDAALIMKRTQSYRTLESIQRYGIDFPKTALSFDPERGLTSTEGTVEEMEIEDAKKAILDQLSEGVLTEKEIKESTPEHKGGVVSKALRLLWQQGEVKREGEGKKGAPFRYTIAAKNAGDVGDSRDNYMKSPESPELQPSVTPSTMSSNTSPNVKDIVEID
jgi:hypothetical protein